MEEFKKLAIKANYVPQTVMVDPQALDKVTKGMQQNYPPAPFTTSQENSAPSVMPQTTKEATHEKSEPEKTKFSIRAIVPLISHHFNRNFEHAKYDHGGTFDQTKPVFNPNDGQYYATYVPNNKHYNEFNPGLILEASIDRSDKHTKTFNFDPRDVGVFAGGFKNSYNDTTIVGGVNYTPFNARLKTEQLGTFIAKFGASAGVAYTQNGSYRRDGPSIGDFTALATGLATVEHQETGLGVQLNFLPPIKNDGMVSFALSKSFRGL